MKLEVSRRGQWSQASRSTTFLASSDKLPPLRSKLLLYDSSLAPYGSYLSTFYSSNASATPTIRPPNQLSMPPSRQSTSAAPSVHQFSQSHSHSGSQGPSITLTLWIHDNLHNKQEAWLNYDLFPPGTCKPGDIVEVRPAHIRTNTRKSGSHSAGEGGTSSSAEGRLESGDDEGTGAEGRGRGGVAMKKNKSDGGGSSSGVQISSGEQSFLFVVREMEREMWLKQPKMQVYAPNCHAYCSGTKVDIEYVDFFGSQCSESIWLPIQKFCYCHSCTYPQ